SNGSVRRPASQVCGRALRLNVSKDRVAAHPTDKPLRWRDASASFPRRNFSIPEAPKARLTRGPNPAGYPYRETLVTPSRRVRLPRRSFQRVWLGPKAGRHEAQQASAAIDRCSFAPDNISEIINNDVRPRHHRICFAAAEVANVAPNATRHRHAQPAN